MLQPWVDFSFPRTVRYCLPVLEFLSRWEKCQQGLTRIAIELSDALPHFRSLRYSGNWVREQSHDERAWDASVTLWFSRGSASVGVDRLQLMERTSLSSRPYLAACASPGLMSKWYRVFSTSVSSIIHVALGNAIVIRVAALGRQRQMEAPTWRSTNKLDINPVLQEAC